MNKSLLVKIFGFPATLAHGDTLVLDRWNWLKQHLPKTRNEEKLLDVGCGTGAFTIGAALRGYNATGLSWDERNQTVAQERAGYCHASRASFEIFDVRNLHEKIELKDRFDIVVCTENIEHILDDKKLILDISNLLRPGGYLLLSSPNKLYVPIEKNDQGPFHKTETGWHVRKGYTPAMLRELCAIGGLEVESIGFCSGIFSQLLTKLFRSLSRIHPLFAWVAVLPFRIIPPLVDPIIDQVYSYPGYSITLYAYKPRFQSSKQS